MPNWLHKTTKQLLHSVCSGELPESKNNYIEEPDLSAVAGQPSKYWTVSGNQVRLMNDTGRAAVDSVELASNRENTLAELDQVEGVLRAFTLVLLDEINVLRAQHTLPPRTIAQLKSAVRTKLGS